MRAPEGGPSAFAGKVFRVVLAVAGRGEAISGWLLGCGLGASVDARSVSSGFALVMSNRSGPCEAAPDDYTPQLEKPLRSILVSGAAHICTSTQEAVHTPTPR